MSGSGTRQSPVTDSSADTSERAQYTPTLVDYAESLVVAMGSKSPTAGDTAMLRPSPICNGDTYENLLRDTERLMSGYRALLWVLAEYLCRTSLERRQFLLGVELPFYLSEGPLIDLKLFVRVIEDEQDRRDSA